MDNHYVVKHCAKGEAIKRFVTSFMENILECLNTENRLRKIYNLFFLISDSSCKAKPCNQASTYENILGNFCMSDFGKK